MADLGRQEVGRGMRVGHPWLELPAHAALSGAILGLSDAVARRTVSCKRGLTVAARSDRPQSRNAFAAGPAWTRSGLSCARAAGVIGTRCSGSTTAGRSCRSPPTATSGVALSPPSGQWHERELAALGPLVREGRNGIRHRRESWVLLGMFAQQTGPKGHVIAFEPARRAFAKLRATSAGTDSARWSRSTSGAVAPPRSHAEAGVAILRQRLLGHGGARGEEVQIRRLDEIPEARDSLPQLIKIDVEGFESEVLAGTRGILARTDPCSISSCAATTSRRTRSMAMLEQAGYETRALRERNWSHVPNGTNSVVAPSIGAG